MKNKLIILISLVIAENASACLPARADGYIGYDDDGDIEEIEGGHNGTVDHIVLSKDLDINCFSASIGGGQNFAEIKLSSALKNSITNSANKTNANATKINNNTIKANANTANISKNTSYIGSLANISNKNISDINTNKSNIASNLVKIKENKFYIGINSVNIDTLGTSIAKNLGGTAKYNKDKSISMSDVGGTGKNTINDAIAHVNQGYYSKLSSSNGGIAIGVVNQLQPGETLTYDANKNIKIIQKGNTVSFATKDNVNFDSAVIGGIVIGSNGINVNNQRITNLKSGSVAKDSTDAVTGSQVHSLATSIATVFSDRAVVKNGIVYVSNIGGTGRNTIDSAVGYVNNRVNKVNKRVDNLEKDFRNRTNGLDQKISKVSRQSRAGVASVAAMSSLGAPSKACGSGFSVALGGHQSETALAMGYSGRSCSGNLLIKASVAIDSQNQTTIAGSATFEW